MKILQVVKQRFTKPGTWGSLDGVDLDLAQLRTLAAVVDAGSLEGAAQRLHLTTSAVSQRLRALEAAAGRVLLVRSRPVSVTPSGEPVLRLARQVGLLLDDAAAALGQEAHEGLTPEVVRPPVLPLAVNADSLATWVLPALAPLAADVSLDLRREDQARTSRLLRDGTVMGAITAEAEPVAGCSVTRLGAMRYLPVAAPSVVGRWFGDGLPAGLERAPVVVFDRDDDLQDDWLAARAPGADPPRHHVPASADFAGAVLLGYGWALLPAAHAEAALARADLVLLDGAPVDVPLFWQQWRLRSPALDAVAAALVAASRTALVQPV